jgi:SH3-like domain-containing protein
MRRIAGLAVCAAIAFGGAGTAPGAASAEEVVPAAVRGTVTNLPLPRFVSLKTDEGNVRRGPSLSHRIDWVFRHRDMPLLVTAEFGHWRRVEDRDGMGGWIHYSLLSGVRTVVVTDDLSDLRMQPDPAAQVIARAESGVIARVMECNPAWCRINAGGERGWVPKDAIWGVGPDEVLH